MSGITAPALGGLTIYPQDAARQRRSRRRLAGVLVIAMIAGSGAFANALHDRMDLQTRSAEAASSGPFSYFPR